MDAERATATVYYWVQAHDGDGFYYVDDEYPDEGSVGAFATMDEACTHARDAEYRVKLDRSATKRVAEGGERDGR